MSRNKLVFGLFIIGVAIVLFASAAIAATQTIQGDIYTIKIQTKDGKATVTITPKTVKGVSHYCNPEFPWKLVMEEIEGVTTDRKKYESPFKKAGGGVHSPSHTKKFGKKKVVFEVKYTAAAGKKVKGKLTFSVCDPKQCYRKTHKIEWE